MKFGHFKTKKQKHLKSRFWAYTLPHGPIASKRKNIGTGTPQIVTPVHRQHCVKFQPKILMHVLGKSGCSKKKGQKLPKMTFPKKIFKRQILALILFDNPL